MGRPASTFLKVHTRRLNRLLTPLPPSKEGWVRCPPSFSLPTLRCFIRPLFYPFLQNLYLEDAPGVLFSLLHTHRKGVKAICHTFFFLFGLYERAFGCSSRLCALISVLFSFFAAGSQIGVNRLPFFSRVRVEKTAARPSLLFSFSFP